MPREIRSPVAKQDFGPARAGTQKPVKVVVENDAPELRHVLVVSSRRAARALRQLDFIRILRASSHSEPPGELQKNKLQKPFARMLYWAVLAAELGIVSSYVGKVRDVECARSLRRCGAERRGKIPGTGNQSVSFSFRARSVALLAARAVRGGPKKH